MKPQTSQLQHSAISKVILCAAPYPSSRELLAPVLCTTRLPMRLVRLLASFIFFCYSLLLQFPRLAHAENPTPSISKLTIVTTTGMLADTVRNLVPENILVKSLIGSGVDPHMYKPTRSDIASLLNADLIFFNGLQLEGRFEHALERIARAKANVVGVGDLLDPSLLQAPEDHEKTYDPHIWMDPVLWKEVTQLISQHLIEHFPHLTSTISRNTERYLSQLDSLHAFAESSIGSIAEESRILVTAHDAFHYFGHRYNVRVIGIQGVSTESEAGIRDINNIVRTLIDYRVPAVFIESTVSDRNVQAIREGSTARGHHVALGGTLFSDAMGKEHTLEGTYVGMLRHNITTFVTAMQGRVEPHEMENFQ